MATGAVSGTITGSDPGIKGKGMLHLGYLVVRRLLNRLRLFEGTIHALCEEQQRQQWHGTPQRSRKPRRNVFTT